MREVHRASHTMSLVQSGLGYLQLGQHLHSGPDVHDLERPRWFGAGRAAGLARAPGPSAGRAQWGRPGSARANPASAGRPPGRTDSWACCPQARTPLAPAAATPTAHAAPTHAAAPCHGPSRATPGGHPSPGPQLGESAAPRLPGPGLLGALREQGVGAGLAGTWVCGADCERRHAGSRKSECPPGDPLQLQATRTPEAPPCGCRGPPSGHGRRSRNRVRSVRGAGDGLRGRRRGPAGPVGARAGGGAEPGTHVVFLTLELLRELELVRLQLVQGVPQLLGLVPARRPRSGLAG